MAEFPALPLFTDAITADCGHLTDEEFGRYVRLLILMWRSPSCRIPCDPQWICKRLRVDALAYAQLVQPILQEFCKQDNGHWVQKRLLKEYQFVQGLTEKRRKAAVLRWEKQKGIDKKGKNGMQVHKQSISTSDAPTPTPTPTLKEDTNVSSKGQGTDSVSTISTIEIDMLFQGIWNKYPGIGKTGATGDSYKGSKNAAFKEFSKLLSNTKGEDHAALIRGIEHAITEYAAHLKRNDYPSRYLSKWIENRGWEDDYSEGQAGAARVRKGSKHERARTILAGDDPNFLKG